jgi:hypothetical protein
VLCGRFLILVQRHRPPAGLASLGPLASLEQVLVLQQVHPALGEKANPLPCLSWKWRVSSSGPHWELLKLPLQASARSRGKVTMLQPLWSAALEVLHSGEPFPFESGCQSKTLGLPHPQDAQLPDQKTSWRKSFKTKRSKRPSSLSLHRSKESRKEVFPKANFPSHTRKPHLSLWPTLGLEVGRVINTPAGQNLQSSEPTSA